MIFSSGGGYQCMYTYWVSQKSTQILYFICTLISTMTLRCLQISVIKGNSSGYH